MADNDRLYQLQLTSRPLFWGDLGNRFQLSGFILQGEETTVVVLSPNACTWPPDVTVLNPSPAEWWDIIRASDDPKVFELDETGGIKAVHRKMQRTISGMVQQKIWARDEFACRYCGRKMGEVQLSIDHFVPWELGGQDNERNYLSACRGCNKRKGSKRPEDWCREVGRDFAELQRYLATVPSVA